MLLLGLIQFTNRSFLPHRGVIGKKLIFYSFTAVSRKVRCVHNSLGRRATSSPFFSSLSPFSFPLFFFLSHWTKSISSKWICLCLGDSLFLNKVPIVLEVRKGILDFGISWRRMRILKKRISGSSLAWIQIRKGTPTSRIQLSRSLGGRVEQGGISACSPLNQLPLYRTEPIQPWG